jgi:hypothetical protein
MLIESQSADPHVHHLAIRVARACRNIVQACLREEEWGDADREFYKLIREGLEEMRERNVSGGKGLYQACGD